MNEAEQAILTAISDALIAGRKAKAVKAVGEAIAAGIDPSSILGDGLLAGMNRVGDRFREGEMFVPEVLLAASTMKAGIELLRPLLTGETENAARGTVVIGTVKGDQHDIGKNLVKIMMEGRGLRVVDLGTDVEPSAFVAAAKEHGAGIIACSALLTTTMPQMKAVVEAVTAAGLRGEVRVMVGGAPVTGAFAAEIGADIYTADAASAAVEAENILSRGV